MDKKKFNYKRLLYSLGYFAIIVIIAFISSGGFSNNPDWGNVIRKIVTTWSMSIVLMYLSYNDKILSIRDDFKSPLMVSTKEVKDRSDRIYKRGLSFAFAEYTNRLFQKRRIRYLMSKIQKIGITDDYVLKLSFNQLNDLKSKPLLIDGHAFDILTPEQFDEVIKCKTGKYEYKEIPSDYFLTASNSNDNDIYGHYANIAKYRRDNKLKQIGIKMLMIAVFAVAFALVAPPDKDQLLEMIMTMLSTSANGIGGIITGVLWARKDAKDQTDENNFKASSVDEFFSDYESGIFVPRDLTETVKQKLRELEEKENLELDDEIDELDDENP